MKEYYIIEAKHKGDSAYTPLSSRYKTPEAAEKKTNDYGVRSSPLRYVDLVNREQTCCNGFIIPEDLK